MSIQALPNTSQATPAWLVRAVSAINALISKANNTADLTLTAGAASTDMNDARLGADSALSFMPRTAHAATAHGTIYVTDQKQGFAKINHANTADVDKTFRVAIHG